MQISILIKKFDAFIGLRSFIVRIHDTTREQLK